MIGDFINSVLKRFDRRLQCESTFQLIEQHRKALLELYTHAATPRQISTSTTNLIEGIVFSKDRPLQLHGLLESYLRHAADPAPLHVLFKASSGAQRRAYDEVFACFADAKITAREEHQFRDDTRALIAAVQAERVVFLVDDILFIEPFAFADLCRFDLLKWVPTLRLGRGIDYCYTRSVSQKEPPYFAPPGAADPRLVAWNWCEGEHEYAFPLSLDGHIFDRREIEIIAAHSDFVGPNTFETILQLYIEPFLCRQAVAYAKPRLVNVPWNRVQSEWDSRNAGVSDAELLRVWEDGQQLDTSSFDGYVNRSTHEELPLKLVRRSAGAGASATSLRT